MSMLNRIYHFNPSRKRLKAFLQRAADSANPSTVILDAGAGDGLYRDLFSRSKYLAVDFGKVEKVYGKLDTICDLKNIPFRDGVFDIVVCTQVLEHLPEPKQVLQEINRLLKAGGVLWLSAPFFFPEHEIPYDYYRYTRYGLTYLLEFAGFSIRELDWLEGYFGSLSYQLRVAARALPLSPRTYGRPSLGCLLFFPLLFLKPIFFAISLLFAWNRFYPGRKIYARRLLQKLYHPGRKETLDA